MIICILSLLIGFFSIIAICKIIKNNEERRKKGIVLYGKKLNCEERFGTPIRYVVKVEFVVNGSVQQKKIITTDKNIKKYIDNESIPLIYINSKNKVYWMEEKSNESIVIIILLASLCMFAFLVFVFFLIKFCLTLSI